MKSLIRTATLQNLDELLAFDKSRLEQSIEDPMDREIASWDARWRLESLQHYLTLGWSVTLRNELDTSTHPEGRLLGYFLAQPLLFFEGQTQSLWVEHLSYISEEVKDLLVDTVYRMAREKHLQRLLISEAKRHNIDHPKATAWSAEILSIPTTKA